MFPSLSLSLANLTGLEQDASSRSGVLCDVFDTWGRGEWQNNSEKVNIS